MDNDKAVSPTLDHSRTVRAHWFFVDAVKEWAYATGGSEDFTPEGKLAALASVPQQHRQIVAIELGAIDDDQLIFETLNDGGTALLSVGLIKNLVVQRCNEIGADVDAWGDPYWAGRDNYWLTGRVKDEIPADKIFDQFRKHLGGVPTAGGSSHDVLAPLSWNRTAQVFRPAFDPC